VPAERAHPAPLHVPDQVPRGCVNGSDAAARRRRLTSIWLYHFSADVNHVAGAGGTDHVASRCRLVSRAGRQRDHSACICLTQSSICGSDCVSPCSLPLTVLDKDSAFVPFQLSLPSFQMT